MIWRADSIGDSGLRSSWPRTARNASRWRLASRAVFSALGSRPPDERTKLNPDLTFTSFVTGKANDLARAADIVLPGSAWVEKDGTFTNDQGRVQASAKVFSPPGEALDDREIFFRVARALGQPLAYASAGDVRVAIAEMMKDNPAYASLGSTAFARPVTAKHWLHASNPSERWKWDFMFQEVNTQKWDGLTAALPQLNIIPLTPVQEGPKGEVR